MDILIFDMDGVLIDVSRSYRETIERTVQVYFEICLGFEREEEGLVSKEDIALFKSAGGFNNDWDLTSGLLLYLLSISGIPPSPRKKTAFSIEEAVSNLKKRSLGFHPQQGRLVRRKDFPSFIAKVKAFGGGLRGVRRALEVSWDGWVYQNGDLAGENVVKRIFQEIYLGEKFRTCYGLAPLFYGGEGYYLRERLLIPKQILTALRKKVRMGIASGRPRFEAELALKRFRLLPYFDSVVTLDECIQEEARILHLTGRKTKCSKPNPYPLLKVLREIAIPDPRWGYVGDVVDDMLTAQAAKEKGTSSLAIGFLSRGGRDHSQKESLLRAGADRVIAGPKELLRLVNEGNRPS